MSYRLMYAFLKYSLEFQYGNYSYAFFILAVMYACTYAVDFLWENDMKVMQNIKKNDEQA